MLLSLQFRPAVDIESESAQFPMMVIFHRLQAAQPKLNVLLLYVELCFDQYTKRSQRFKDARTNARTFYYYMFAFAFAFFLTFVVKRAALSFTKNSQFPWQLTFIQGLKHCVPNIVIPRSIKAHFMISIHFFIIIRQFRAQILLRCSKHFEKNPTHI